jgi:hypothetical protein
VLEEFSGGTGGHGITSRKDRNAAENSTGGPLQGLPRWRKSTHLSAGRPTGYRDRQSERNEQAAEVLLPMHRT